MNDKSKKLAFIPFNSTWKNKSAIIEGNTFPERCHSNRDRTIPLKKPIYGYSDFFKLPYENIEELRYARLYEEHMPTIQEESIDKQSLAMSSKTNSQEPKGLTTMTRKGSFTKNLSNLSLSSIDSTNTESTAPTSKSTSYSSMESTFSEAKEAAEKEPTSFTRKVSGLFSTKTDEKTLSSNPLKKQSAEEGLSFVQKIIDSKGSKDPYSVTLQEALAQQRQELLLQADSITLQEAMAEKRRSSSSTEPTTNYKAEIERKNSTSSERSR